MELYRVLIHLHPKLNDADFVLQDDGDGPYIKSWLSNEIQKPSDEQLVTAWEEIKNNTLPPTLTLEQQLEEEKQKVRRLEAQNELNNDNFIGLVQALEEAGVL
jgi:hypothetical protein